MRGSWSGKQPRRNQEGVILFVSIVLLFILSLIGVTVARMQTVEERMAQNENNRQLGVQAAEAALRSAEAGLLNGTYTNFAQNANGLYELTAATGSVVPTLNWSAPGAALNYAGPALNAVPPNVQTPQFVIENLPPVAVQGQNLAQNGYGGGTPPVTVYRVTARGVGADQTSTTVLQSIFR